MLNTTSITLPRKLTTTQKAARGVIFQCLQKMEMGCLTIIESFHTETKERSERLLRHTENTVANLSLRPLRLSTQVLLQNITRR